MAIFNITNNKKLIFYKFRTSNINIKVSTLNFKISKEDMTTQEWSGNN